MRAGPDPHPAAGTDRVPHEMLVQRTVAGEADEVAAQRLDERQPLVAGQGMAGRDHEHEAVGAEGIGLQSRDIGVVGRDTEVGQALRHRLRHGDARPLVEIHVDVRMGDQEAGEELGQEFHGRRRVRHQADVALQPMRVLAEVAPQPFHLPHHQPGMMQQGRARRRGPYAAPAALQKRHADLLLHAAHASAGGRQGKPGARATCRDAACLDHEQEQTKVGQVEMHVAMPHR